MISFLFYVFHPPCSLLRSGALQIGDHILSINGTVTDRLTNFEASSLLENAGNVVNLELAFDAPPEGMEYQERVFKIIEMYICRPSCDTHVYLVSYIHMYSLIYTMYTVTFILVLYIHMYSLIYTMYTVTYILVSYIHMYSLIYTMYTVTYMCVYLSLVYTHV